MMAVHLIGWLANNLLLFLRLAVQGMDIVYALHQYSIGGSNYRSN